MKKESARLLAGLYIAPPFLRMAIKVIFTGRHVSIERAHSRSTHTIASLFNKLKYAL